MSARPMSWASATISSKPTSGMCGNTRRVTGYCTAGSLGIATAKSENPEVSDRGWKEDNFKSRYVYSTCDYVWNVLIRQQLHRLSVEAYSVYIFRHTLLALVIPCDHRTVSTVNTKAVPRCSGHRSNDDSLHMMLRMGLRLSIPVLF